MNFISPFPPSKLFLSTEALVLCLFSGPTSQTNRLSYAPPEVYFSCQIKVLAFGADLKILKSSKPLLENHVLSCRNISFIIIVNYTS